MKKLLGIAALAALVLTGCSKDLQVKTTEKQTVEYGDKLDNDKLYDAKESDKNVKVDKVSGYDAKKVGDQTLKVTFSDEDKSTEKEIKITVQDTKKPEITLKKDKITITAGDKLTLKDNVKSVKDPVDGDLKYSEKELKKSGYYIDKGKLDTKKAGTYEIKVLAYDANGNSVEKSFKVIVKKKPVKKAIVAPSEQNATEESQSSTNTAQQSQNASPSSGGVSSNGNNSKPSSSSNGANGQTSSTPQPQELCPGGRYPNKSCDTIISHPSILSESTGVLYDSPEAAENAGAQYMESSNDGYDIDSVLFNDNSRKWVVQPHANFR